MYDTCVSRYARNYAKYAELAGISYTTYYTDYNAMTEDDKGSQRFSSSGKVWNYRSNFDWATVGSVGTTVQAASSGEQLMFVCHAMNKTDCKPGAPPDPDGALSPACKAAVAGFCGAVAPAGCNGCVRAHAQKCIAAGCPAGGGAAGEVIAYCETLGGGGR